MTGPAFGTCTAAVCGAVLVALCVMGGPQAAAAEPATSAASALLDAVGPASPLFEEVGRRRLAGDERGALDAWRNETIARLRVADLGAFEYHAYTLSDRQIRLADFLAGKLSQADYASQDGGPDFFDLYGFAAATSPGAAIDWVATSADALVREKSQYGSFAFSTPLTAAFWKTQDPEYLDGWFAIAADFARNQRRSVESLPLSERRVDNAPWLIGALPCLHQGNRVITMIRCLAVFAKSLPAAADGSRPEWANVLRPVPALADPAALALISADDLASIVHSLTGDHPKLLLDFYYRPGALPNQRGEGLAALLTLAALFPDIHDMEDVAEKAGEAMNDYLAVGFYRDGGMLEQSLNYNVNEAERLRALSRLLRANPPHWLPRLADRLRGFDRLLVGISTPMQELPVIGNNTSNPPAAWKGAEIRRRWLERRPSNMPRIEPASLGFASIAFPYSGYFAQRRDWHWDSPYMLMTNARPARGHHSMDNLAIEVHAYGRPLLVRGGPPPYGLKFLPEHRRSDAPRVEEYFNEHSSYKLNTVVVDGHSQTRTAVPVDAAYDAPVDARWHATASFDLAEGRYRLGYGPRDNAAAVDFSVTHQRRVIHVRELSCWVVTDTMLAADQRQHDYTQIWKFPPFRDLSDGANNPVCGFNAEQVACGDGSIRTTDPNGPNIWLYHFSNIPLSYKKLVGETDPYRGWYARFLGDLIPAVDIHASWRASGETVVATLIWPTPGKVPPPILKFSAGGVDELQSVAGFTANLRDGGVLAFAESVAGPRHLRADGIQITGDMLLVVRRARTVRGLVLGCVEWTDDRYKIKPQCKDFEFVCRSGGGFDVVAPITVPRGFGWIRTREGVAPSYNSTLDVENSNEAVRRP